MPPLSRLSLTVCRVPLASNHVQAWWEAWMFREGLAPASALCSLCVSSRRVDIQVPKPLGFSQLAERLICHDPASEPTRTLTNGLAAGALRNVLGACLSSEERPRDGYQRYQ